MTVSCPRCNAANDERDRFCERCGLRRPHLRVEINELSFYMHGVQTRTSFQVGALSEEEVRVRKFWTSTGGNSPKFDCRPGEFRLKPEGGPFQTHCYIRPESEYCPKGSVPLEIHLEYETGGKWYRLRGEHDISVLPETATPKEIQINVGNTFQGIEASAPTSLGSHFTNLAINGFNSTEAAKFIEKKLAEYGQVYKPLALHVEDMPPPPDWAPANKATLWFEIGGVMHNYCILSRVPVVFGRAKDTADVRLYEVEICNAYVEQQVKAGVQKPGSGSKVGRHEWKVAPEGNGLSITQLECANPGTLDDGTRMRPGNSYVLGRNASVAIEERVGLRLVATATPFPGIETARATAREVLDRMTPAPFASQPWNGETGGYCLSRLYSLTGKPVLIEDGSRVDYRIAEYYVVAPGWITLGSSTDSCIRLQADGVAPLHAAILFVDGCYFIAALGSEDVFLDDTRLDKLNPWPIRPHASIRFGNVSVGFGPFKQLVI